jgi:hypothetical protein
LQEGIDFTISVINKTFWHKIKLKKPFRKFVMYPICLGTLLKISELIMQMDAVTAENHEKDNFMDFAVGKIKNNAEKFAEIIALAIINKPFSDNRIIRYIEKIGFRRLVKFINSNVNDKEALDLINLVVKQMDIQHFLACMVSIKGMDLQIEAAAQTSGD